MGSGNNLNSHRTAPNDWSRSKAKQVNLIARFNVQAQENESYKLWFAMKVVARDENTECPPRLRKFKTF